MRVVVSKQWRKLQAVWQHLYDSNPSASPFQSYDYLSRTGKGQPSRREPLRLMGVKELNLILYNDGEPVAVAALLYHKKNGRRICYLRGHFTAASYLDLVYVPGFSYDDFTALMNDIKARLGNAVFQFDRIRDNSVTCQFMCTYFSKSHINKHECAAISLAQSCESWQLSLHKSTRQSLSNRRNRLLHDKAEWSVVIRRGCDVDMGTYKKAMRVCAERYMTKNTFRLGALAGPAAKLLAHLLLRDKITQWVAQSQDSLVALLYINGEIAAFASMVVSKDKRVSGIRFAICSRFSRYAPGGLLLSALIRHLINSRQRGELDAGELDMGQGISGGSAYKFAYGGEKRYLYYFSD